MTFAHLHVHSHYSLLEGAASPAALVARAVQCRLPALALTDHNGLYGAVPFVQAARAAGLQPLLGLELDLASGDRLVLLAQTLEGYHNLCRLSSAVLLQSPQRGRRPGCGLDLLQAHHRGLLALSGGHASLLAGYARQGRWRQASRLLGAYATLFGPDNFFVELVLHDPGDAPLVGELVGLADELGLPAVATNDTLGAGPADGPTAELLDALRTRTTLVAPHPDKAAHPARYLKTPAEMEHLFADWPQVLAHTGYIARRCQVELPLGARRFPGIALPAGETAFSQLWKLAFAGVTRRYQPLTPAVTARLQTELHTIEALGFAPYFLIVADIVRWCRRQGIPAMGRGSAADSLVAYVLDITPVDPLAHQLYFERFLNAERADPPDIDLDLCWRRRDEVLDYVYRTYGRDHVAMIGTHIRFQLRSAWRDVACARGLPAGAERALAGRPWGYTVAQARQEAEEAPPDPAWGETYPPAAESETTAGEDGLPVLDPAVLEACAALDGAPRHLGIHCGGLVIAPFPITDEVPLQRASKGLAVTQYEMHAIEALGLVKIDLLGSRALSALSQTAARVRVNGTPLDLEAIPWDDPATYVLLAAGRTLGCFQLESPGMRALLRIMQPHCLDDLIAAVSLFRPGPLEGGLKDTFLARLRDGTQPVYPHPAMAAVLAETHGVILYQEQFLRLVHELAGFSLAEAEALRKAIAADPRPDARAALRARFVAGAIGQDLAQPVAEQLWATLEGFTGFGFCKGHAAAYATIAYRTAYCKAHHPAELLAAMLTNQAGFYPAQVYIEEARRLGLRLRGPDVNRSAAGTRARAGTLQLGLRAVKGLRRQTLGALLAARRAAGPFRDLRDLLERVALSRAEITTLIQVGALDRLAGGRSRPELLWQARLWGPAAERRRAALTGQIDLPLADALPDLPAAMPVLPPYSPVERLGLEQAGLGLTLSANPLTPFAAQLARQGAVPAGAVAAHGGKATVVAGLPVVVRHHTTRAGTVMAFVTLQDLEDLIEVVIMPDALPAALPVLATGGPVLVRGVVEPAAHGGATLRATRLHALRLATTQVPEQATEGAVCS